MLKRTFLILFIFSGLYSCCSDVKEYWNIDDFDVVINDFSGNSPTDGVITADSLKLILNLERSYVQNPINTLLKPNTLTALSCEPDGWKGMDNAVTKIKITSRQDFNDFPAGTNLNSFFTSELNDESIENFVANAKDWYPDGYYSLTFLIKEKPNSIFNQTQQFDVEIEFSSGDKIKRSSPEISWL